MASMLRRHCKKYEKQALDTDIVSIFIMKAQKEIKIISFALFFNERGKYHETNSSFDIKCDHDICVDRLRER